VTQPRDPALLSQDSLQAFFQDLLQRAIDNQRARPVVGEATERYLVNLLGAFLGSEALYVRDEDGSLQRKPLAILLKEALDEQGAARAALLRKLGDTSLFVSGFFGDSLTRSAVSVDYYRQMGSRAYDALGQHVQARARDRSIYADLAERFGLFMDLLAEVSERTLLSSNGGLLRLYEKYIRTGSERLASVLRAGGVPLLQPVRGKFAQ
jgi:hypothetical protein